VAANLKDIVSQASLEIGITLRPVSAVTGSLDQDVVQMGSLMQAVADELLLEEPYRHTLGDGFWVIGADGTPKKYPTHDTDIVLFDTRLAIDGLKYRFLAAKGLEFAEAMRDFTVRLNKLAGRVNGRVLDLDTEPERTA
jgi:hypothetical protein